MLAKKRRIATFLCNLVLFFAVIILHYTDGVNISIATATPMLLIPLLVAFSIFSSVPMAMFVGLICGILADAAASGAICFNALALMLISTFVCALSNNLFNKNIHSASVLSLISCVVYFLMLWLVRHAFSGVENSLSYLLKYALPSAVYTSLFIFPFYYFYKFLNNKA